MDELEVAALHKGGVRKDADDLLAAARGAGVSPLVYLEGRGEVDSDAAARMRAEVLGLPVAAARAKETGIGGVLPPGIERRHGLAARSAGCGALVLAAPRPSPALAREVADLLPGWRIAWQVASGSHREGADHGRAA
jgi:hypothetical protein